MINSQTQPQESSSFGRYLSKNINKPDELKKLPVDSYNRLEILRDSLPEAIKQHKIDVWMDLALSVAINELFDDKGNIYPDVAALTKINDKAKLLSWYVGFVIGPYVGKGLSKEEHEKIKKPLTDKIEQEINKGILKKGLPDIKFDVLSNQKNLNLALLAPKNIPTNLQILKNAFIFEKNFQIVKTHYQDNATINYYLMLIWNILKNWYVDHVIHLMEAIRDMLNYPFDSKAKKDFDDLLNDITPTPEEKKVFEQFRDIIKILHVECQFTTAHRELNHTLTSNKITPDNLKQIQKPTADILTITSHLKKEASSIDEVEKLTKVLCKVDRVIAPANDDAKAHQNELHKLNNLSHEVTKAKPTWKILGNAMLGIVEAVTNAFSISLGGTALFSLGNTLTTAKREFEMNKEKRELEKKLKQVEEHKSPKEE